MLRRAAARYRAIARAASSTLPPPPPTRALASASNASLKTADEDARARAEREAERRVRASDSPLFNWVEVDVKNADRDIPRWQNALFVACVGGVFAYFGQRMISSETERRRRVAAAKAALEDRARAIVRESLRLGDGDVGAHEALDGLTPEEIEAIVESERRARER